MKIFLSLLLLLTLPKLVSAQTPDPELEAGLREVIGDFDGDVGVYVHHLKTGREAAVNADTIFPTASIVKVPILISVFERIRRGDLGLNDSLTYDTARVYGGSGLMQFFRDGSPTDLRTLASLMITVSDNTTSLWCQELVGGGAFINGVMQDIGLEHTRVNSRTEGREAGYAAYGWGQTTPREMTSLLVKLRRRELINPASSDAMYRLLTHTFYTDYSLSQVPPYVQAAAKQGMVNASRSELVMVNAPHGDYAFYVATKNNADVSWEYDNAAWQLQRDVSRYLWTYFEPDSDWAPAAGAEELLRGLRY